MTVVDDRRPGRPAPPPDPHHRGELVREVPLVLLVLYGLGTTIGAGIYALTGEVAAEAGMRAPLAFIVAAVLAGLTGLGFAELAGRLPKAAGEAVFVDHAFGRPRISAVVGWAVMFAGVVSAAAITKAFGGYIHELVPGPKPLALVVVVAVLCGIAVAGAKESVGLAGIVTVVEIGGLLLVVWVGREVLATAPARTVDLYAPPGSVAAWSGVLAGAFLAFFAFMGFEDIDAMAEETPSASRNLPKAILITLGVTLAVYVGVATVAVLAVAPAELGESDAPLSLVYERVGGTPSILGVIAALAMINGALIHMVMVPRVAYGLTRLGLLPQWAGLVSRRTDTPVRATVASAVLIAVLAVAVDLAPLARVTSATTLAIFISVNAALLRIKRRDGPTTSFSVPAWYPAVGLVASVGMLLAELGRTLAG